MYKQPVSVNASFFLGVGPCKIHENLLRYYSWHLQNRALTNPGPCLSSQCQFPALKGVKLGRLVIERHMQAVFCCLERKDMKLLMLGNSCTGCVMMTFLE